jgi:hypothetical protein
MSLYNNASIRGKVVVQVILSFSPIDMEIATRAVER